MKTQCRRIAALVTAGLLCLALPLAGQAITNPSDEGVADDRGASADERNVPTEDVSDERAGQSFSAGVSAPGCGNVVAYSMSNPPICLAPNCEVASTTGLPRAFRDAVATTCAAEKNCPGNFAVAATVQISYNIFTYDAADCTCVTVTQLQLQNPGPPVVTQPGCTAAAGITIQAWAGTVTAASLAGGIPANCNLAGAGRFLGESGAGLLFNPRAFSFALRPGETSYSLVVATSGSIGAGTCVGTITTTCGASPSLDCKLRPIIDALAAAEAKLDRIELTLTPPASDCTLFHCGGARR